VQNIEKMKRKIHVNNYIVFITLSLNWL